MKKLFLGFIVLELSGLFFVTMGQSISVQTYEKVILVKDTVSNPNYNIKIYNVFKAQTISAYKKDSLSEEERNNMLVEKVYIPYNSLWEGYLGSEGRFLDWCQEKLDVNGLNNQAANAVGYKIDTMIMTAAEKMSIMTQRNITGNWYIIFGPALTDLGGIGNGNMLVDLANKFVDKEHIEFILPHELNHQIYDYTSQNDPFKKSVLYRCIDEGFATYVNQLFWGYKFSPAKNLLYSEEEYMWCLANEKKLFEEAKEYLFSTSRNDKDLLASRSKKMISGGPGAQGYFIGYRICEEYVKKYGALSWSDIYDIPVQKLLELSGLDSNKN